ncbi:bZIP transcription factor bZIP-1 [Penicillium subrubescens]|uniref:bZIP transcription factor bZIP-1 n=1 Tax=Penicillium subrubescens TaxID=1316194 RepID=UPI002545882E|nr:bZIP transcription factor bZIP-1 [Penicillium subrubescens]KAJ5890620.1 bZIP transcription factor bZIP-1 [Penicillium subrubescens]
MEDYWGSQSASFFGMQFKSGEMPVFGPRTNHKAGFQGFEIPSAFDTFTPHPVTPAEVDCSIQSPDVYQTHNLDSTVSINTAPISPSPSTSDSQEGQTLSTCARDRESQSHELQTMRRRMQNRDAQRRFRGRKEERYQTLQQRSSELEAKCQELSERFNQKSEEIGVAIRLTGGRFIFDYGSKPLLFILTVCSQNSAVGSAAGRFVRVSAGVAATTRDTRQLLPPSFCHLVD